MDEKTDEIIGQIEARRDELGRNLSELEEKVRRTADWHTYFDRNPMMILGAALGGGILVGAVVGGVRSSKSHTRGIKPWKATSSSPGKSSSSVGSGSSNAAHASARTSSQMHQVGEALEHIKGAMIAFGISKTKELLAQAVPGLENHLGDFGKTNGSSSHKQPEHDPQPAKPYSTGSAATNTGRPAEAEEYAGAGSGRTTQAP
ncbi:MAG: hypothetical protein SGI92_23410 [Bryobacteraceae bacterium]|nr:hypothetical protein [Bryobacteraceae bacterium]